MAHVFVQVDVLSAHVKMVSGENHYCHVQIKYVHISIIHTDPFSFTFPSIISHFLTLLCYSQNLMSAVSLHRLVSMLRDALIYPVDTLVCVELDTN